MEIHDPSPAGELSIDPYVITQLREVAWPPRVVADAESTQFELLISEDQMASNPAVLLIVSLDFGPHLLTHIHVEGGTSTFPDEVHVDREMRPVR